MPNASVMTPTIPTSSENGFGAALGRAVEATVVQRFPGARIDTLERSPAPRRSSWWLENVSVTLADGSTFGLVLKSLGREAPGSRARTVKPGRVAVPWREPWVYREVLSPDTPGPPRCYAVVQERRGWTSLLLERVEGEPLTEVGDPRSWHEAAAWLARFHARRWAVLGSGPLLWHDRALHRWWFRRALARLESAAGRSAADAERARRFRALETAHARACEVLDKGPTTLLHGEFQPSNVLVEKRWGEVRIRPVDWEMAGLGPPLMDLAALTSGAWTRSQRVSMALAYRHAALAAGAACPPLDRFLWNLDACGLLLGVQWLGWAEEWVPPPEHRTDWLEEAVRCAERLVPSSRGP